MSLFNKFRIFRLKLWLKKSDKKHIMSRNIDDLVETALKICKEIGIDKPKGITFDHYNQRKKVREKMRKIDGTNGLH